MKNKFLEGIIMGLTMCFLGLTALMECKTPKEKGQMIGGFFLGLLFPVLLFLTIALTTIGG